MICIIKRCYYLLIPNDASGTKIYIPVESADCRLRKVMTKAEALEQSAGRFFRIRFSEIIYKARVFFDKMYDRMNEAEKLR